MPHVFKCGFNLLSVTGARKSNTAVIPSLHDPVLSRAQSVVIAIMVPIVGVTQRCSRRKFSVQTAIYKTCEEGRGERCHTLVVVVRTVDKLWEHAVAHWHKPAVLALPRLAIPTEKVTIEVRDIPIRAIWARP
jgi:hypothetical protein